MLFCFDLKKVFCQVVLFISKEKFKKSVWRDDHRSLAAGVVLSDRVDLWRNASMRFRSPSHVLR